MADDKIIIAIEFDDGTVKEGFLKIEKQAGQTTKNLTKDFKEAEGGLGGMKTAALAFVGAFAGIAAVNKAINFFKESVAAAAQEQDAINRLNQALALTGKFSADASQSIQNFANELQKTTKFGNETTLEVASLIQSLGNLDTQGLQRATEAALNLSTALGIDVNSAATLVGKAAAGSVEAFSRYGIKVQKAATDSQTFANVLQQLESRFGGSAQAAANTFSGSLTRLQNVAGDFKEEIGRSATESGALVEIFKIASEFIVSFSDNLRALTSQGDVFKPILVSAVDFVGSLTFLIQGVATLVSNLGITIFTGFIGIFQQLAASTASFAGKIVGFFAPNSELAQSIKMFAADVGVSATENFNIAGQALEDAFTLESTESTALFFDDIKMRIQGATVAAQDFKNALPKPEDESTIQGVTAMQAFGFAVDGAKAKINDLAKTAQQGFANVGATAVQGLGQATGQAFAAFGRALATGQNALKAFTAAFLASIGQTAVNLGTEFILRGIAYSFVPGLQGFGPPLIAAGAALATFGGVLAASGPGVGAGGGAGGGAGQVQAVPTGLEEAPDLTEPQQPTTQVAINIQGDVMDSRDSGLRIVELIKEYTDRNGRTEVLA